MSTTTNTSTIPVDETIITRKITYKDSDKVNKLEEKDTKKVLLDSDPQGVQYEDPIIVVDESNATEWEYKETKDESGNVIACKVIETHVSNDKPSKSKVITEKSFDKLGRMISEKLLDDNRPVHEDVYSYYYNTNKIKSKVRKHPFTREYYYYDTNEMLVKVESKTLHSKAMCNTYEARYDDDKNLLWKKDGKEYLTIQREYDKDNNLLSEIERYYTNEAHGKLLTTKIKLYCTLTITSGTTTKDVSKLVKVVTNDVVTEFYKYNTNGDIVKMFKKDEEKEVLRRIEITKTAKDTETGISQKTEVITEYITLYNGEVINKKYKNIYEMKEAVEGSTSTYDYRLITSVYDDEYSTTIQYTYDDENRRTSAITTQTIDGEEKKYSIISYTYTTSEDGKVVTKTKKEEIFDKENQGCVLKEDIHIEETDDSLDNPTFTQTWKVNRYKTVTNTVEDDTVESNS